MAEHARSGMAFADRVSQLITVAVGLDDWEWGVTLWAKNPEFLKDIVYRMRFDEASARYAEFGPFYVSYLAPPGRSSNTAGSAARVTLGQIRNRRATALPALSARGVRNSTLARPNTGEASGTCNRKLEGSSTAAFRDASEEAASARGNRRLGLLLRCRVFFGSRLFLGLRRGIRLLAVRLRGRTR